MSSRIRSNDPFVQNLLDLAYAGNSKAMKECLAKQRLGDGDAQAVLQACVHKNGGKVARELVSHGHVCPSGILSQAIGNKAWGVALAVLPAVELSRVYVDSGGAFPQDHPLLMALISDNDRLAMEIFDRTPHNGPREDLADIALGYLFYPEASKGVVKLSTIQWLLEKGANADVRPKKIPQGLVYRALLAKRLDLACALLDAGATWPHADHARLLPGVLMTALDGSDGLPKDNPLAWALVGKAIEAKLPLGAKPAVLGDACYLHYGSDNRGPRITERQGEYFESLVQSVKMHASSPQAHGPKRPKRL